MKRTWLSLQSYFGTLFLAGLIVGTAQIHPLAVQTVAAAQKPAVSTDTTTRFQPPVMSRRATMFYESEWGVDELRVKVVESGELIRFSYEVLDPDRSKTLNDKKLEPALIFPAGHIKLVIPSLEKVGQLRQSSTPIAGKSYWMAFSNPGRKVKRGDRVDIAIGSFHAEGLVVE